MIPILLALAFIAILFIVVIAGQPDEFKVVRSAKIPRRRNKFLRTSMISTNGKPGSQWAKMDPA